MGRGGKRKGAGRKPLPKHLKGVKVGVSVPKGLLSDLDQEAQRRGLTRTALASLLVCQYLVRLSKKGEKNK